MLESRILFIAKKPTYDPFKLPETHAFNQKGLHSSRTEILRVNYRFPFARKIFKQSIICIKSSIFSISGWCMSLMESCITFCFWKQYLRYKREKNLIISRILTIFFFWLFYWNFLNQRQVSNTFPSFSTKNSSAAFEDILYLIFSLLRSFSKNQLMVLNSAGDNLYRGSCCGPPS